MKSSVQKLTQQYVRGASESVALMATSIAAEPRENHPFVFFHLRKAAGSTVRKQLDTYAHNHSKRSYVACFSAPCETYAPPQEHRDEFFSIYGGHYSYPSTLRSLFISQRAGARVSVPKLKFDCLVLLRKPTSRVQSCWNYRLVEESQGGEKQAEIGSMDAVQLASKLPTAMSSYGEGCNNEALRVLSSTSSEEVVNTLTSDPEHWSPAAPVLLEETLHHMQKCVVGVVERCDDTMRAVHAYFPWFKDFDCKRTQERKGQVKPHKMSSDVEAEIGRQNMLEQSVYEVANALLDAQLQRLQLHSTSDVQIDEEGSAQSSKLALMVVALVGFTGAFASSS